MKAVLDQFLQRLSGFLEKFFGSQSQVASSPMPKLVDRSPETSPSVMPNQSQAQAVNRLLYRGSSGGEGHGAKKGLADAEESSSPSYFGR